MLCRKLLSVCFAGLCTVGVAGCDVDVEDSGELPSVDVDPGEAPDVDVHGPDVDVDSKETTVEVPDVDMEKKKVTVPDVDVDVPEENEN